MRDTRNQLAHQVREVPVEIANKDRLDVTQEIFTALSSGHDVQVSVTLNRKKYFTLTAERFGERSIRYTSGECRLGPQEIFCISHDGRQLAVARNRLPD